MLHIVTFATDESKLIHLKRTSELAGLDVTFLMKSKWMGWDGRLRWIMEFMENISDNDVICFIDAYDVLAFSNKDEILDKFYKFNSDLVLGAELNCYPEHIKHTYPQTSNSTNYKYVNAGGYIGYKHAIEKLFTWKPFDEIAKLCMSEVGGDQHYVSLYYIANYTSIALDTNCSIFQNMHWVNWNDFDIVNGRIVNRVLQTLPCFMHFNGQCMWTDSRANIMPIIVYKLKQNTNLREYRQLITNTQHPHNQVGPLETSKLSWRRKFL